MNDGEINEGHNSFSLQGSQVMWDGAQVFAST